MKVTIKNHPYCIGYDEGENGQPIYSMNAFQSKEDAEDALEQSEPGIRAAGFTAKLGVAKWNTSQGYPEHMWTENKSNS